MKVWATRIWYTYLGVAAAIFFAAAVVQRVFGTELALRVLGDAECWLVLPIQFVVWIISWFSNTPGAVDGRGDNFAINNVAEWVAIVAIVVFIAKVALKKLKQAWAGVVGGGGHH